MVSPPLIITETETETESECDTEWDLIVAVLRQRQEHCPLLLSAKRESFALWYAGGQVQGAPPK